MLEDGLVSGWAWRYLGKLVKSVKVECNNDVVRVADGQTSYTLIVSRTECYFGGSRPWFICPNKVCNKRVAILYLSSGFFCRTCLNLQYEVGREGKLGRSLRRVRKNMEAKGKQKIFDSRVREQLSDNHVITRPGWPNAM